LHNGDFVAVLEDLIDCVVDILQVDIDKHWLGFHSKFYISCLLLWNAQH